MLPQGGLVNSIERRVQEAQEYVEQAKENVPKCKKLKKTSKRVRVETHTFLKLTCISLLPPSTLPPSPTPDPSTTWAATGLS